MIKIGLPEATGRGHGGSQDGVQLSDSIQSSLKVKSFAATANDIGINKLFR